MEKIFENLKSEILKRAKSANACTEEYKRAYRAESFSELIQVIKDNFNFAVSYRVIDAELIEEYRGQFNENEVFCNVSVGKGYLLASGNATVEASGNATVEALGNATVRASGNATVEAWGNATVEAWGNATVEASGNATVEALGNATVEASGNATVEAWGNATVEALGNATVRAWGNATVEAWGNATVRAWGNAYTTSYSTIECKLSDKAIYRVRESNIIYYASDDMKFEKQ